MPLTKNTKKQFMCYKVLLRLDCANDLNKFWETATLGVASCLNEVRGLSHDIDM